jgi:DNA-binding MarR family transcriptional regulator
MVESAREPAEQQVAPEATVEELGRELTVAIARLHRRLRAEKADDQMPDTQSSVLAFLTREGPHTLRQLSDRERVTPPSMNQTVNSLAEAGYVVRQQDPTDGRKVLFVPTPAGVALAAETRRLRHAWLNAHLQDLPPETLRTLLDAARTLRQIADA